MKENFYRFCRWFGEAFNRILRHYPVELMLILYGSACCIAIYHENLSGLCLYQTALLPLFLALALTVNLLPGRGLKRWIYRLCWIPIIPLAFWVGLPEWVETIGYRITLGVLAPLAVLMACRAKENGRFIGNALVWLRAGVLSMLFSYVALGLFCAILYSTTYIFSLDGSWINETAVHALILCQTLCVPVLWLMMVDRWLGASMWSNKILDILLNYIITPAMLIYGAILYLYIVKIVVTWSLPLGGVAYIVFGFTIFTMIVMALQEVLRRRMYDWFFNRFSLYALPPLALFWVGVAERIGQYGLTEPRVWLVICGCVMTLAVGLFLTRRSGRYLYVAMMTFVIFAAVTYVPAWNPMRIAIRSQTARAERLARGLGLLREDGTFSIEAAAKADTAEWREYEKLDETFRFLESKYIPDDKDSETTGKSVLEHRFGLTDHNRLLEVLPEPVRVAMNYEYGQCCEEARKSFYIRSDCASAISVTGYRQLIVSPSSNIEQDTLTIGCRDTRPDIKISGRELIEAQLRRVGAGPDYDQDMLERQADQFMIYETSEFTVCFYFIEFYQEDSLPMLEDVGINAVLLR